MNEMREETLFLPGEAGQAPRKNRLTGSLAAKVTAFILLVAAAGVTVGSVLGAVIFADQNLYTVSREIYQYEQFQSIAWRDGDQILTFVTEGQDQRAREYCGGRNIAQAAVYTDDGASVWKWSSGGNESGKWDFSMVYDWSRIEGQAYTVRLTLLDGLPTDDTYAMAGRLIGLAYALRYWIYAIIAAASVLTVVCFVFLLCAAGHHAGEEGVRPGWGTWIPLDVLTVAGGLGSFTLLAFTIEWATYSTSSDLLTILLLAACVVFAVVVFTGYCMSLALRFKLGSWWKKTAVYGALVLAWRVCRLAWRKLRQGLSALRGGAAALFRGIPLVWKTAVVFGGLSLLHLVLILTFCWAPGVLVVLWFFENLLLFPLTMYCALTLRKLQKGGEALAAGDLSYQLDTRRMLWDFRKHGENLNSIAQGMTRAVDQRMKSERLKTELITNVSHDIKTPLTSIINYADLIGKEPCGSEKITEYAGVLLRQSERLKKLIEDLVEASKASTGSLEVLLAPCEAGVLLTQAAGEYEKRLAEARLELVTRQPDHPVTIMADGRRLWRVFDNLMSNICKYAQEGTRVYLTLEEEAGEAVISFKNTSRSALDISADELLERFVRGDASRNTEGNGLGLSIAKSLTDLQKGRMELTVDGDLFKVVLRFPMVS